MTAQSPSSDAHGSSGAPPAGARVLAVTSGKGGVGKSSIALNLALHLRQRGHRVCLFDADTNLANLNILLGLTPSATLGDLLRGEKGLDEILLQGPEGLRVVPAASGIQEFLYLEPARQRLLLQALRELEQRFDHLILDTAAGIDEALVQLLLASGELLLVITPEPTSLTDAFSLLKVLKRFRFDRPVEVVVNQAESRAAAHDSYKRFHTAVARFLQLEVRYLGYVLRDPQMGKAVMHQRPILLDQPEAVASLCLRAIGERLEQRLPQLRPGGLATYFDRLQVSDDELERLQPFARETGSETTEAAPAPPPDDQRDEGDDATDESARERRDLVSAAYYAGLLAALEQDGG